MYFDGNVFYTSDDYHARDEYGLGYSVGKCVLGYLPNIVDLCSYFRVLCASTCGTSHDLLQYDLHKIMFSTMERVRCDRHKSNNLIKLKIGLSTTEQNLKRHTTFNIPNLTELRDKRKRGESVTLNVSVDQVLGGNYTISEDSTESLCLSGIHEANGTSSTREPFTHEPFTHEPFTHEPSTHEPFTHEPSTHEPYTHEPSIHEPSTHEPFTHEPFTHESSTHEPSTHEPSTHEPFTHEPFTHESSTHEPSTHEPFTHEPFTHEPSTHEPFTHEPSTHEPSTHEPSTHEPSTHEPFTHEPSTHEPSTHEPSTHEPFTHEPFYT